MKKLVIIALVAFLGAMIAPTALMAQKQKIVVTETGVKYEKSRGTDENVKTTRPTDDTPAAPKEKTRGEVCYVYIDNYTGYAIDIYVDGDWMGTVAAYGSGYTYAIPGETKLYGKSTGGTMVWGPHVFTCSDYYTWSLY
jgi:hypothetical protein